MVFKLLWLKVDCLLVDDVPSEIEHFLRDFHILDVIEVLVFVSHLVRVAEEHSHEPLIEGLQSDDVIAAREDHAADRDHVHITDGLADDSEGVVTDFAVRD
jgi:hypothetical protein